MPNSTAATPDAGEQQSDFWRPLHEFAYVERPFRDVRRRLADRPAEIIPSSATAHLAGLDVSREIRLVVGELQIGHRTAWLTVRWQDLRHPQFFPLLRARLEFMPAGTAGRPATQVALRGHYQPPLGRIGQVADSVAGHAIAVQAVQGFLGELTLHLERALPPAAD